jgi:hypothetical protein
MLIILPQLRKISAAATVSGPVFKSEFAPYLSDR